MYTIAKWAFVAALIALFESSLALAAGRGGRGPHVAHPHGPGPGPAAVSRPPAITPPRTTPSHIRTTPVPRTLPNPAIHAGAATRSAASIHAHTYSRSGYHPNWYHGHWNDYGRYPWRRTPAGWWAAGVAAGVAFDAYAPWRWGYWRYYNPYWSAPVVVGGVTLDYSQPIASATTDAAATSDDEAAAQLDAARNAFLRGDYAAALSLCNKAVAARAGDALPHEMRALALFALKRYKEAAGIVYAVLSAGPGWDWNTLSSLYPDVNVYTGQLRELEDFISRNPNAADARFLLAYHYLTCGHTEAAVRQLKAVVQLNPKDSLAAQLLAGLTTEQEAPPSAAEPTAPATTAAPAKPVEASALIGDWKAAPADDATIALKLDGNGKYTWTYSDHGKTQQFSGAYAVADNLLILKQGDAPMMVGQVNLLDDGRFQFKLPGENPNDPGLTFAK